MFLKFIFILSIVPFWGVEGNTAKQALFPFSMSKIRDAVLYGMFSLSAYHILFGVSWLIDSTVNGKGHDKGQTLTFTSLPLTHKYNPREGCEKILLMSKTWVERTISKSKKLFVLLLVRPNASEKVAPFHPFIQSSSNESWDETFYNVKPLDDRCLPHEYKPTLFFVMSCDKYIKIFNKLIKARSYAFNWFEEKALKSIKNSYMFKRGGALNTLGIQGWF